MLISGACLGGALPSAGTWSRKPFSLCTPKLWSLASLAGPDFFPDSLPASCGTLAPFRLSSFSQPQSSPWGLILCAGSSPLCAGALPLHHCCCALLCGSEAFPCPTPSPLMKGLPSVWKLFFLHSSLPEVQVPCLFFCLCFFFFLLPYPGTCRFSCLLGSLRSSASIQ